MPCPACHSKGIIKCERCHGQGQLSGVLSSVTYSVCHGSGQIKCPNCGAADKI